MSALDPFPLPGAGPAVTMVQVLDGVRLFRGHDLTSLTVIDSDHGVVVFSPVLAPEQAAGPSSQERPGPRHDAGQAGALLPPGAVLPGPVAVTVDAGGRVFLDDRCLLPPAQPEPLDLDGVPAVFLLAPPGTAPAAVLIWLPSHRLVIGAEEITHRLHELMALRGGAPPSAGPWWRVLDTLISLCATEVEAIVAQHHWPLWGNEQVLLLLRAQRDILCALAGDAAPRSPG